MSIQVENNLKNTECKNAFDQKAHFIPSNIDCDGQANVDKYFEPYVTEDENEGFTASFRGYPLDGKKISLPSGYQALLATEAKKPLAEGADRRFQIAGGFKDFVYWNWDKKPSKNDNIYRALDWPDIAEAIHGN